MAEYEGLIIESGSGPWLFDINGNRYLDGASSMWCNLFGHRNARIDQAIRDQLGLVAHVTNLGMSHPTTIRLAEMICSIAPPGLSHAFFSSDGASAVEVALKLAFQYWQQCSNPEPKRTKFIALGSAYHGDTIGTVSVSGVSRFQKVFEPLLFDVLRGPCPDRFRVPNQLSETDALAYYLAAYRNLLEQHRGEIAAFLIEPIIQGAAGFVVHPSGFLSGIARLCREFDVLLIADEIAVGLGRTGRLFACEHELLDGQPIAPDLMCLGKGLTGGYLPMSATLTSDRIWNAFLGDRDECKTFFHGHTFGGNPLAAAAALATLELLLEEGALDRIQAQSEKLNRELSRLQTYELVGDIRQVGMMAAIDLVSDRKSKHALDWTDRRPAEVCRIALHRGVWLRPLGNVIPIVPPLILEDKEIELLVDAIAAGLEASCHFDRS